MPPDASSSPRTFLRIPASEWKRKAVHMGSFGAAFLLPYLTPKQAALMAIGALLFNMFVLPKLMPSIIRREGNSGYLEILMYPAAVLISILTFSSRSYDVADIEHNPYRGAIFCWFVLAIGDAVIGLVNRWTSAGSKVPWNERKSLASIWISPLMLTLLLLPWLLIARGENGSFYLSSRSGAVVVICYFVFLIIAIIESLWFGIVDNLVLPCVAALMIGHVWVTGGEWPYYRNYESHSDSFIVISMVVPLLFGGLAWLANKITMGAAVLGAISAYALINATPWLFLFVLGFFLLGNLSTKFGMKRKLALGIAEFRGGQRGAAEVFGSIGAAVWLIPLYLIGTSVDPELRYSFALIIISPLIAKTMDTVSSEMGKAIGGTTISLRTFKVVPPGTDGGVSLAGTVWGLAGAALLALLILPLHWGGLKEVGLLVAFAVAANLFESYWAFWAGPRGVDDGPHTNFMMTLFAATLAWFWWM